MLHRTERFVLGLLTVGLILLVAIQMMMTSEETRGYLQMVEGRIQSWIHPVAEPVTMMADDEYVTIRLLNQGGYSKARVMVNNEQAFYFAQQSLRIPVSAGDFLILDTRGIAEALWFEIMDLSPGISSIQTGQQYRVFDGLAAIPVETAQAGKM